VRKEGTATTLCASHQQSVAKRSTTESSDYGQRAEQKIRPLRTVSECKWNIESNLPETCHAATTACSAESIDFTQRNRVSLGDPTTSMSAPHCQQHTATLGEWRCPPSWPLSDIARLPHAQSHCPTQITEYDILATRRIGRSGAVLLGQLRPVGGISSPSRQRRQQTNAARARAH